MGCGSSKDKKEEEKEDDSDKDESDDEDRKSGDEDCCSKAGTPHEGHGDTFEEENERGSTANPSDVRYEDDQDQSQARGSTAREGQNPGPPRHNGKVDDDDEYGNLPKAYRPAYQKQFAKPNQPRVVGRGRGKPPQRYNNITKDWTKDSYKSWQSEYMGKPQFNYY